MTADEIIAKLGLVPLQQEGGYYRETYRCGERIPGDVLASRYGAGRVMSTAIYYLVTPDSFSRMHRVKSDEVFHFYLGDPVVMLRLYPRGTGDTVIMGQDIADGMNLQCMVPHGTWQGMRLLEGGDWALLGTTVSPGFEFEDYETGEREALTLSHPAFESYIDSLT